jgi:hypothetical protein
MSTRRLAKLMDYQKTDTDRTIKALRLQSQAWRLLTMIALVYPEESARTAQWLLFKTVPWVDDVALTKFVSENQSRAETCGLRAGVFTHNTARVAS